ncbi:MAG: alpha/beta hydrolase [Pseudomonadota bacterium]|nr:alpha/beta hydrolase [Pseudomonadota bacterium]
MLRRWAFYLLLFCAVFAAAGFAAFKLSPWPSVLLVRQNFDRDSSERNRALEKHQPRGITRMTDIRYGEEASSLLDVYVPEGSGSRPAIIWIHGGAFIAGNKHDLSGYLPILAASNYTLVAVGYALAPGAKYPAPVLQANAAVAYVQANAGRFGVDSRRIYLAGDSAGAQIAAQLAAGVADPAYAERVGFTPAIASEQLRGAILFCGVYDAAHMKIEGAFGGFLRTVLWSYFGKKDMTGDPRLEQFAVTGNVTSAFPPTFISAGNADPLEPQSRALAGALAAKGVAVDALFFPSGYSPPLQHEYQFSLDIDAGRLALNRLEAFLSRTK